MKNLQKEKKLLRNVRISGDDGITTVQTMRAPSHGQCAHRCTDNPYTVARTIRATVYGSQSGLPMQSSWTTGSSFSTSTVKITKYNEDQTRACRFILLLCENTKQGENKRTMEISGHAGRTLFVRVHAGEPLCRRGRKLLFPGVFER